MTMGSELTLGVFLPRAVKDNMPDARLMGVIFCRSDTKLGVADKYICAIILCQRCEANNSKHATLWPKSHRYRIARAAMAMAMAMAIASWVPTAAGKRRH